MIGKTPFRDYSLKEDKKKADLFSVRLDELEREILNDCKLVLEQTKDSTALKSLAWIGANVIHDPKTRQLLDIIFKNKKNNKRSGVVDFE